jgi:type II secretory pathway pseudopilin PulG
MPVSPGFSAIELLLVAGIISLLVAVAVPNFLDAKVRAEVADVQITLNRTSNAIKMYRTDYNRLPEKLTFSSGPSLQRLVNAGYPQVSSIPVDRFKTGLDSELLGPLYEDNYITYDNINNPQSLNTYSKLLRRERYDSFTPGSNNQWILKSIGPDRTDFADEGLGRGTFQQNLNGLTLYDTSNGIFSLGEIVKANILD